MGYYAGGIAIILSLLGYIFWLSRKGIEAAFAPVLTMCGIGIAMFLAGLFHVMVPAVWGIFLGGFLCGFLAIRGKGNGQNFKWGGVLLFCCLCLFFLLRLRNADLTWPDNFTHWAVVVRDMLRNDRLPDASSSLILFRDYATGTAGIQYLFCKIMGERDTSMLFALAVILASCLTTFWAFVREKKVFSCLLICLASLYLLTLNIIITELCVDTLLGLLGMSSFAAIWFFRDHREKAAAYSSVMLGYLCLVKTSGILFAPLHLGLLLLLEFAAGKWSGNGIPWRSLGRQAAPVLLLPLLVRSLWSLNVSLSYPGWEAKSYALTPGHVFAFFFRGGNKEVYTILYGFYQRLIHPQEEFLPVIACAGVFTLMALVRRCVFRQSPKREICLGLWCLSSYLIYLAGMLGMYLFSMIYEDASQIASYARYLYTILLYIIGICVIYLLDALNSSRMPGAYTAGIAGGMIAFLLITTPAHLPSFFVDTWDYSIPEKQLLQEWKCRDDIPDNAACYIVCEDAGSTLRIAAYELWSDRLELREDLPAEEFDRICQEMDYLIILKQTPGVLQFQTAYGLPQEEGVYSLAALG